MTGADGWNADAIGLWAQNARQPAIQATLAAINAASTPKPVPLVLQLAYYLFLTGDPAAAARFLAMGLHDHPDHPEILRNLAACLSRSGQADQAIFAARRYVAIRPDDASAWDTLAANLHRTGDTNGAVAAGTRALSLKDQVGLPPAGWSLPAADTTGLDARPGLRNVLTFALWGADPRYLRGVLDNALAAPEVYPGWQMRVHADASVPAELLSALTGLGVRVIAEPAGQPMSQRLAWRFRAANDPGVNRFLVRDADSVISRREAAAVADWMDSGRWFHVMRDWWTHTDVMLAGMWGGVAGVLPPVMPLVAGYRPPHLETPNVDQWFLRDRVWPMVRQSCLVHDRCFVPSGATVWPAPSPTGSDHVGQCEFTARGPAQAARLARWIDRLSCLR
ncbi:MAG: tetratricopeptide repeat protein [Gemmobacter sp.]|nr:tetratricopeptide repeat protein [Gemmobacter sp.]